MAAVLMAENHIPTDFILHPLMWSVFLKDAIFHTGGSAAAVNTSWGYRPDSPSGALNASAPMGLNVIVTPFVEISPTVVLLYLNKNITPVVVFLFAKNGIPLSQTTEQIESPALVLAKLIPFVVLS
jgi:hypothetical protein